MIPNSPKRVTTLRLSNADADISTAATLASQGHSIVFPTDTVYGVGTTPFDAASIDQIYAIKGRDRLKSLPILISDITAIDRIAIELPPIAQRWMAQFWPGALTLIVPRQPSLPSNLSSNDGVAIRMPNHPVALALIRQAGGALATTSANLSGEPAACTAEEAHIALAGRVAAIVDDGPVSGGLASTIVDCRFSEPLIIREGPILATALSLS